MRRLLLALALGFLALGGAMSVARAQFFFDPRPEPSYQEAPRYQGRRAPRDDGYGRGYAPQPYGYEPGYQRRSRRAPPAANYAPPPQPEFRWPWEQQQAPPPAAAPRPVQPGYGYGNAPRRTYVDEAPREIRRRKPPRPAPVVARERAVKPKTSTASIIAVFGDSLAEGVAQGLEDTFEDDREMGVVRKTRGDSGLVRADLMDWPKTIQDFLKANPKVAYVVMLVGSNDSQPIREGDQTIEPLSDRWREIYRDRVDAVIKAVTEKNLPLVWIGAPPVRNERLSTDLIALNEIYRDRVQKAGGVYVDIWPGFVDDKDKYAAAGPDVDGQTARLRSNDGIGFTRAGGRKAAHFANLEIKRLLDAKRGAAHPAVANRETETTNPAAAPAPASTDPADVDRAISASLPALPEPAGLPSLPARPVAGPVVPLTRAEVSPGGSLVAGRPRFEGDSGATVDRALRSGVAPQPQPGRADDFKWPRS